MRIIIIMLKMIERKKGGVMGIILTILISLCSMNLLFAQEQLESFPCPKPYIKLIKPNLAKEGQQIIIRGHRFGEEKQFGGVIFTPALKGKIISWRNCRITAEVPSGAKTGKVIVKTKCATSNGEFFKVGK
jgi:hypothetical protein